MKAAALVSIFLISFLVVVISAQDVGTLVPKTLFNEMLSHRSDRNCTGGFYTYNAFITAAKSFSKFGTTGNTETRKREIAAFFAHTSYVTNGWLDFTVEDPGTWGYCFVVEQGDPIDYCSNQTPRSPWPCAPGRKYYGRGPFQLHWNSNYAHAGAAIGADLINNPDLVATDPVISFKTALWFWMTRQAPKLSCHAVITGKWKPTSKDISANRLPGFGLITNILDDVECGTGADQRSEQRIVFYKRYCSLFGVSPGKNLECDIQSPFS